MTRSVGLVLTLLNPLLLVALGVPLFRDLPGPQDPVSQFVMQAVLWVFTGAAMTLAEGFVWVLFHR